MPADAHPGFCRMSRKSKPKLVLGRDYIVDRDGRTCLTAEFLRGRGECCDNSCRYCPFERACTAGTADAAIGGDAAGEPSPAPDAAGPAGDALGATAERDPRTAPIVARAPRRRVAAGRR